MKRNMVYRQCRLVKRIRDGERILMSYIPAEFAREGRIVKLREDSGDWDDGWVIRTIGRSMTGDQLTEMEVAQRAFQRETSKD